MPGINWTRLLIGTLISNALWMKMIVAQLITTVVAAIAGAAVYKEG